ncbi:SpoIIE family protein phosphatase [Antrihabitans sp. YC2-6]|uniref:SpoIIE family protein phosphatase n=1 Tax=Antrihabitans sp. YC2-6 TaxID=2799498 RepID=UPI0018F7A870|nr:SpoIIE family protein phosphatase [Antrihabitans sp. YC2-6]MBJ8346029.1 SpoIIE family protein phosphatase [Antrihabitans sp. YC2-6]
MTDSADSFRGAYAAALRRHLAARSDSTLEAGHELGRWALSNRVSLLDITENHFRTATELGATEDGAALQFLLQTFTALDIATRGFLDGTRRYEQQRTRAEDLAERDAFRRALVDSLQDGFFVADGDGTIVEVNGAFGEMTGYGPEGVPYEWPHPWLPPDDPGHRDRFAAYLHGRGGRFEVAIRHRDGRRIWLGLSSSSVTGPEAAVPMYVGTIRNVTAEREVATRERAAAALATALVSATSVAEVLGVGLRECCAAVDSEQAYAAVWPEGSGDPVVFSVAQRPPIAWTDLAERTRTILDHARHLPALTVTSSLESMSETPRGFAATLGEGHDATMMIELPPTRTLTTSDRGLLFPLVGQLSLALQRARNFDQARTTSLTLQRAMLGPLELPPRFAVRYEPAVPPLEIGGDWYDVVPLPENRIGIIVGDCVGRGLSAAAVMGQLRTSGRALLLRGAGPGQLLDELDAVAHRIPGAVCTTVCAAILDPDTGVLRYSSAGHMPAMLAAPGAVATPLNEARAVPLATFDCAPRPEATADLPPGSTIVVFTDGLVERRTMPIDAGFDAVAGLLSEAAERTADEVADMVLAGLQPAEGYDDDVAMVVYRQPPALLVLDVDAQPTQLAVIRRALQRWLSAASIPPLLADDVISAANEICTNSVEHAYRNQTPERVILSARADPGELIVTVADTGTWIPPAADPGLRGRGLPMARALTDDVQIEHMERGTAVTMRTVLTPHRLAVPERPTA